MIEEIENTIISKLKSQISRVYVESFSGEADLSKKYKVGKRAIILVIFGGAEFENPEGDEIDLSECANQFAIFVGVSKLKGHRGAYQYIEKIIQAMTGFRLQDSWYIYPKRISYEGIVNEVFWYSILFEFKNNVYDWIGG